MNEKITPSNNFDHYNFLKYWEELGFFDNIRLFLPREFFILFEISRLIAARENGYAYKAVQDLFKKDDIETYDREKSILIDRVERKSPLSEKMEIENFKTIYDLKKVLPRELTWTEEIFKIKLMTKTLLVQQHFESAGDHFKPITPARDESGHDRSRFEQKFFLLLDRSRSMENRMRSFYSKSIVIEFLRSKLESNAKLFFRAFDSKPGTLEKIENKNEFASLIEKVILTTTGGTSTNMQDAILQAIEDMRYDKEMMDSEILVVTDGLVDNIDLDKMKAELKDIRLNILKIGFDLAEPNGFELKRVLAEAGYDFDPFSIRVKDIKKKIESADELKSMSKIEQSIYEYMLDHSNKIIEDIKKISYRFIEIEDLKPAELALLNEDNTNIIEKAVHEILQIDRSNKTIQELSIIYKKAYFLSEYIKFLLESRNIKYTSQLQKANTELTLFKEQMLSDPYLLDLIMRTGGFEGDMKDIKASKKKLKKAMKNLMTQDKNLTKADYKNAQLLFTMSGGGGEGNTGLFLLILFRKLIEFVKSLFKKLYFIA